MAQRLGIAAALLGNPSVLMFDEPVNGLDPEGIVWVRNFMKALAAEGRTVLVSSHLMSEMSQTAEHLVVIGRGRLIADMSMDEFVAASSGNLVRVRSPQAAGLRSVLTAEGHQVADCDGYLEVRGLSTDEVGELAAKHDFTLHELAASKASLEAAFMELTQESVEYHAELGEPDQPEAAS
jgi:ABC-2 type transport system ATP-binding protein